MSGEGWDRAGNKGGVKWDPRSSGLCPDAALVPPEDTNIVFNPWHSPLRRTSMLGCRGRASKDGIAWRI